MALGLKTKTFYFGDPTTGRTPSCWRFKIPTSISEEGPDPPADGTPSCLSYFTPPSRLFAAYSLTPLNIKPETTGNQKKPLTNPSNGTCKTRQDLSRGLGHMSLGDAESGREDKGSEWQGFHHKQVGRPADGAAESAGQSSRIPNYRNWLSPTASDKATHAQTSYEPSFLDGQVGGLGLFSGVPAEADRSKLKLASPQVPSTAVYVKGLLDTCKDSDIEEIFRPYLNDGGQVLIVPYYERGVAFVDLGSTDSVVRAVTAARSEGLKIHDQLLTVEPSKKPVRASGLRAMNVRKRSDAPGVGGTSPSSVKPAAGRGRGVALSSIPAGPREGSRAIPCWAVQEMCHRENRGASIPDRRIVAVFLHKEKAVSAANTLWAHLKANTAAVAFHGFQEILEDAPNGNFYRRLDTGNGMEVRQVTVEAPAYLNPAGQDLRDCTSTCIDPTR